MSSTPVAVMFFACSAGCGAVRPIRVQLDRGSIRRAMQRTCRSCARSNAAGQQQHSESIAYDLEWLGLPPEQFAARMGTTVTAIARLFQRVGRHDLARPFERARRAQRKERKQRQRVAA